MSETPQSTTGNATKQKLNKGRVVLFTALGLVIVGLVVTVVLLLNRDTAAPQRQVGNYVIDEGNLTEIKDTMAEELDRASFELMMSTVWDFPTAYAPSNNAVIGNSASNNYAFYFEIVLPAADGEEERVLYTSDLLPVGTQLKELVLDEPLDAGSYGAVVYYHLIDENGEEVPSDLGFQVQLNIKA